MGWKSTVSSNGALRSLSFGTLGRLPAGESSGLAGVAEEVSGVMDYTEPGETLGLEFFTKTRETRKSKFGASLEKLGSLSGQRDLRLGEQQEF